MAAVCRNPFNAAGVRVAFVFALGIAAARNWPCPPSDALAPSLALLLLSADVLIRRRSAPRPGIAASVVLLFLVCTVAFLRCREDAAGAPSMLLPHADTGKRLRLCCTVAGHPQRRDDGLTVRCTVQWLGTASERIDVEEDARLLLPLLPGRPVPAFRPGDTLELTGALRSIRGRRNPGCYDARRAAWLDGIATQVTASAREPCVVKPATGRPGLVRACSDARCALRTMLEHLYRAPHDGIVRGLLFGERSGIPEEVTRNFRDSGVIHILSVSGTHVGVLLAVFWMLLGRARPAMRASIAILCLWAYAGLTDLSPPVLRSVGMATVLLAGFALQRSATAPNACAVAGLAMLALSPRLLLSPGFQLSFAAVFALLLWHHRFLRAAQRFARRAMAIGPVRSTVSMIGVTVIAQCGTLPILVATFGRVSIVSLAANLVVVPLVFLTMITAFPALLFDPFGAWMSGSCAALSDGILEAALMAARVFSDLPFAVITADRAQSATAWVLLGALAIALSGRARRPQRVVMGLLAAAAFFVCRPLLMPGEACGALRVATLDVGQGDAILVQTPGGASLLVDTGPTPQKGGAVRHTLIPALEERGIDTLDAVLITHPDDDHAGGAAELFSAFPVRRCFVTACPDPSPPARAADSVAAALGIPRRTLFGGDRIVLDSALRIFVLAPQRDIPRRASANSRSLVLSIRFGGTAFLLTGDCDIDSEHAMLASYGELLRADVLKTGHHGSHSSSSAEFIAAVHPRHAVISCGRFNRFGHPHASVLRRLAASGAALHRTDCSGAVVFISDGRSVREYPWREGP